MADYDERVDYLSFEINKISSSTIYFTPDKACFRKSVVDRINFKLLIETTIKRQTSDEEFIQFNIETNTVDNSFHLNLQGKVLNSPTTRETLNTELTTCWPDSTEVGRNGLINYLIGRTRPMIENAVSKKHNVLDIEVKISQSICCYFNIWDDEYHEIDLMMLRSLEESIPRMVPTTNSSIESLMESKKMIGFDMKVGTCESCLICLEEFLNSCEVVKMPCSHFFHGDCIEKWLNTSHYCPTCRFEMPTD